MNRRREKMSVLIKGFKMPKHCIDCVLEEDGYCFLINDAVEPHDKSDNCPFVEVPTPHGDLIDRDEVCDSISYGMTMTGYQSAALNCVREYVVPTVIEAEE